MLPAIKAFTREAFESIRIGGYIFRYRDSMLRALRLMATFHPFIEFSASIGTIVLIYFGGQYILGQTLAIDELVAFFLYLELLYQPVRALSGVWESVQQALAGAERVDELLQEAPDIMEKSDAIELKGRAAGAALRGMKRGGGLRGSILLLGHHHKHTLLEQRLEVVMLEVLRAERNTFP